jgi:hypothetical protein
MSDAFQTYHDLAHIGAMELFRMLRDDPVISNQRVSPTTRRARAAESLALAAKRNKVAEGDVLLAFGKSMYPLMPEAELRGRLGL